MRNKMFSMCLNSMSWTSIFYIVLIFYILCIILITPYEKIQKPIEINKQNRKEWLEKELQMLQEEYDDITLSKKEIKEFIKKEIKDQISIIYNQNFLNSND